MGKIENLLVDLDGTLVDADEGRVRVEFIYRFLKWWKNYGPWWKVLRALHEMGAAVQVSGASSSVNNATRGLQRFSQVLSMPPVQVEPLLKSCLEEIFPPLEKYFRPVPGAQKFIEWAHSRYRLILATNPVWPPSIVELRVKWAGIDISQFSSFTHAQRMKSCKPFVSYYEELLQQEALKPEACLLIGNDYRKDGPATQIGIPVYILSEGKLITKAESRQMRKGFHRRSSVRSSPEAQVERSMIYHGNYSALEAALQNPEMKW